MAKIKMKNNKNQGHEFYHTHLCVKITNTLLCLLNYKCHWMWCNIHASHMFPSFRQCYGKPLSMKKLGKYAAPQDLQQRPTNHVVIPNAYTQSLNYIWEGSNSSRHMAVSFEKWKPNNVRFRFTDYIWHHYSYSHSITFHITRLMTILLL